MKVVVVNHCPSLRVDRKLLARAARFVARQHGVTAGQIDLAVCPDRKMARIHKQYLGRSAVTDVICFDMSEPERTGRLKRVSDFNVTLALGGQVARRQAKIHRTSINKELALYTVHGLLHVLGYDDAKAKDSRCMHQHEDDLLTQIGLGPVFHRSSG